MSEKLSQSMEHVPDVSRLPKLGEWVPMDDKRLWDDGTQILVAVPVCDRHSKAWCYEFSVVVIRCDEGYFKLENSDGDPWGWELDSIEWYIQLSFKPRSSRVNERDPPKPCGDRIFST